MINKLHKPILVLALVVLALVSLLKVAGGLHNADAMIAYSYQNEFNYDNASIYTSDDSGANVKKLVTVKSSCDKTYPAISSNKNFIVYVTQCSDTSSKIYLYNLSSKKNSLLYTSPSNNALLSNLSLSPDNANLVFVENGRQYPDGKFASGYKLLNINTKSTKVLPNALKGGFIKWLSNSTLLLSAEKYKNNDIVNIPLETYDITNNIETVICDAKSVNVDACIYYKESFIYYHLPNDLNGAMSFSPAYGYAGTTYFNEDLTNSLIITPPLASLLPSFSSSVTIPTKNIKGLPSLAINPIWGSGHSLYVVAGNDGDDRDGGVITGKANVYKINLDNMTAKKITSSNVVDQDSLKMPSGLTYSSAGAESNPNSQANRTTLGLALKITGKVRKKISFKATIYKGDFGTGAKLVIKIKNKKNKTLQTKNIKMKTYTKKITFTLSKKVKVGKNYLVVQAKSPMGKSKTVKKKFTKK